MGAGIRFRLVAGVTALALGVVSGGCSSSDSSRSTASAGGTTSATTAASVTTPSTADSTVASSAESVDASSGFDDRDPMLTLQWVKSTDVRAGFGPGTPSPRRKSGGGGVFDNRIWKNMPTSPPSSGRKSIYQAGRKGDSKRWYNADEDGDSLLEVDPDGNTRMTDYRSGTVVEYNDHDQTLDERYPDGTHQKTDKDGNVLEGRIDQPSAAEREKWRQERDGQFGHNDPPPSDQEGIGTTDDGAERSPTDAGQDDDEEQSDDEDPPGGTGDPHYATEDGVGITTQVLGEFLLSQNDFGQVVQARTEPYPTSNGPSDSVATITAMAVQAGGQRVEVRDDGTVLLDGTRAPVGTAIQVGLAEGGGLGVYRDQADGPATDVIIVWRDRSTMRIQATGSWLAFSIAWHHGQTGTRHGLLGSDDGNAANDMTMRDGSVTDDADELARSWRLNDGESLFTYDAGKSTRSYAIDDFPTSSVADSSDAAGDACADVPEGFAKESCLYDVAATGSTEWVEPARALGETFEGQRASVEGAAVIAEARPVPAQPTETTTAPTEPTGAVVTDPATTLPEALTADELAAAVDASLDDLGYLPETDAPPSGITYRIHIDAASSIKVDSDTSCQSTALGGYRLYDSSGSALAPTSSLCWHTSSVDVAPGDIYIRAVGPGRIKLSLEQFAT